MTDRLIRLSRGLLAAAGLLGASGVALGAASAHLAGGDLAQLASFFLLLHAAAIPGILAVPAGREVSRLIVAGLMVFGSTLFSGDLGVLAFTGHVPVAGMAPLGGLMLIAGWLGVCGLALSGNLCLGKTPTSAISVGPSPGDG